MLKRSPPNQRYLPPPKADQVREEHVLDESEDESEDDSPYTPQPGYGPSPGNGNGADDITETAPLLTVFSNQSRQSYGVRNGRSHENVDLEGQKTLKPKPWVAQTAEFLHKKRDQTVHILRVIGDPKCWDRRAIWQNVIIAPVSSLPAVIVGVLLNILDALSYGEYRPGRYAAIES